MEPKEPPHGYRWRILFMSYVCMLSFALVFQSIPPILSLIISDLNITYAQAGLLMSLFALPGIFVGIPSGMISDRIGMKKVGVVSIVLMIVGTLMVGMSQSFLLIGIGRIVLGVGALTLAIVLPQLLSRWFIGRELGSGMGVFNTAMPLGTITSFNVLSIVGNNLGWRTPIFLTTIASVAALLVFLLLFREPTLGSQKVTTSPLSDISKIGVSIWLVGLAWMWFNAAFISFLTFAQDFFLEKGYEIASAGFLSSIVMMGSLFLSPVVGCLASRFGREELFVVVGSAALASLLCLTPTAPSPIPMLVLIGIFVAYVPAPTFSLPSKMAEPQHLGLAFGILTASLNVGVLAGPYLAGLAKDLTGDYSVSFYLMSIFSVLQASTMLILYFLRKKQS